MKLNIFDLHRAFRFLPKELKAEMKPGNVFVGGGYLTSIVKGEHPPNDIDVFVPSVEVAEVLTQKLRNAFNLQDANQVTVWRSDNATTIRRPNAVPIQIIHRWTFEKLEDVANSFDFTCCCAAIGYDGAFVQSYCDDSFYQDVAASRLVYRHPVRNEDAGGSMLRLLKYIRKGYNAPLATVGGVMARMARGVEWKMMSESSETDLTKVLTALLVEVDPNSDPEKILEDREDENPEKILEDREDENPNVLQPVPAPTPAPKVDIETKVDDWGDGDESDA